MWMDHIKRPEKALMKKFLKSDRYSSSHRDSTSEGVTKTQTGALIKLGTNKGNWMLLEFTKDISEIDSKFEEFLKQQEENKFLSKANIPNYNLITEFKSGKSKKKKLKFAFSSGSYRIVRGEQWKRFRFISQELYNLIQDSIIFDYSRIYNENVLDSLTKSNKPKEPLSIIKNANKYKLTMMKTIGRSILPEFCWSMGNITE